MSLTKRERRNSHPMQVMFVHRWGAIMAGGEVWIRNLASHLHQEQVTVSAVLGIRGPLYEELVDMQIETRVVALDYLRSASPGELATSAIGLLRSAGRLARVVREHHISVMHAFSLESAEPAYLASRIARVPLVVTVQNCGPYPSVDIQVLRRCERVVAISRAVERDLRDAGVLPARLTRIPPGIDCDQRSKAPAGLLRQQLGIASSTPLIGMVATLERKKGQDTLLRGLPDVLSEFPQADVVFIGADHETSGAGYGPYETELRSLADALGITQHVHFLGFHPHGASLIADCDVAVLCSRKEGLGLAAVEALAVGVPLVATSVEGLQEVIDDGVDGLLVPPDSPSELGRSIRMLLADRSLATRLAIQGSQKVRRRFDARSLALQNLAVYEQLISAGHERRTVPA